MEDRVKKLETIVARLSRRSRKTTSAIITPYPISNCVIGDDIKGDVLRYMFCAVGTIVKGLIVLGSRPKDGINVEVSIVNDIGGESKSYVMSRKSILVEPSIKVYSGDRLSVSVNPLSSEDKITEVWISFLWVPEVKDADIRNFLINELEGDKLKDDD